MDIDCLIDDVNTLVKRYEKSNALNDKLQQELQTLQQENQQLNLKQEQTSLILRNVLGQLKSLQDENHHAID